MDTTNSVLAALLALVIKGLFPKAITLEVRGNAELFYCDMELPSLHSSVYREIEERMLYFLSQKKRIRLCEMLALNAREYFIEEGEPFLAEAMESLEGLCQLIDLDGMLFPYAENTLCIGTVSCLCIFHQEPLMHGLRIYGKFFISRKDKTAFQKNAHKLPPSHEEEGCRLGLFWREETSFLWSKEGVNYKQQLHECIQEVLKSEGIAPCELFGDGQGKSSAQRIFDKVPKQTIDRWSFMETCLFFSEEIGKQGLLDISIMHRNTLMLFCKKKLLEEMVISSLHFMTKIFTILEFAWEVVLIEGTRTKRCSADLCRAFLCALPKDLVRLQQEGQKCDMCVEWRVRDRLGFSWPVACLETPYYVKTQGEGSAWVCLPMTPFLSLERLVALRLEHGKRGVEL